MEQCRIGFHEKQIVKAELWVCEWVQWSQPDCEGALQRSWSEGVPPFWSHVQVTWYLLDRMSQKENEIVLSTSQDFINCVEFYSGEGSISLLAAGCSDKVIIWRCHLVGWAQAWWGARCRHFLSTGWQFCVIHTNACVCVRAVPIFCACVIIVVEACWLNHSSQTQSRLPSQCAYVASYSM